MSFSWGSFFQKFFIGFFIFILLLGLSWNLFLKDYIAEKPDKVSTLPDCNDGIDNDNDKLIDYPEDLSCKSAIDNSEGDWGWLWGVLLFTCLFFLVSFGLWKYFSKKKPTPKIEDDILLEPIDAKRGKELVISYLLESKCTDLPASIDVEEDGFQLLRPLTNDLIEYENEYPDVNRTTGEKFHFWFIRINQGKLAGQHLIATSLSKGESYIKGGNIKFEMGTWIGNFTKKVKNFNPSSPQDEKARIELIKLDAIREGDNDTLFESQQLLNSINSSQNSSPFVDEDEEMWKERLRLGQNNVKKKGKMKKYQNTTTPEMNIEGGNEE